MNCEQVKYQLIDFVDENISDQLMTEIQDHIKGCAACEDDYLETGKLLKAIAAREEVEPSLKLKTNFYKMLEAEKISLDDNKSNDAKVKRMGAKRLKPLLKLAAQVVVLVALGAALGLQFASKQKQANEVLVLQSEIHSLKQNVSLVALKQPSASERIKAIYEVDKNEYSSEIFEALINTMNTDANVNVRMASMYALAKYSSNENVRSSLIASLKFQTDPLLQITLINILVGIQDSRAKEPIYDLMNKKSTPDIVKEQAQSGLEAFV